jgi:hypothetical protein
MAKFSGWVEELNLENPATLNKEKKLIVLNN